MFKKLYENENPSQKEIEDLLSVEGEQQEELLNFADGIRKKHCGEAIILRGIVEFSSYCNRTCAYCGLNTKNHSLKRYRMSFEEILQSAALIASYNIGTVVLQSGEDEKMSAAEFADIIKEIKSRYKIAVTLSVGERSKQDYRLWKEAGADRYLLKIETSDRALYEELHPGMSFENRLRCLHDLRDLGYQVGSGIIVGLKGQTTAILAKDILFLKKLDLDMIGIGPFIPHKDTPLGSEPAGSVDLTLKTIALTRILTKKTNIPATTALGSLSRDFRPEGLKAGANVLMPNFTPDIYKKLYEIYPGKRCIDEKTGSCAFCMEKMANSLGRVVSNA